MFFWDSIRGRKLMMTVLRVKGLWQRVIRNVGETSCGVNRVTINLDLNPGRERTYNVTSAEKRAHETRLSRE